MRFKLTVVMIFLTAFFSFAQQGDDWFQGRPIRGIVFDGLINVSPSELEGITAPFLNQNFSDELFWDILGRLYALEYFETITPSAVMANAAGTEVLLRFAVVEQPTVSRIIFVGNRSIRRNALLDTILLAPNSVATQIRLRLDEQAIINRYHEGGFPDVMVRTDVQPSGGNTVAVTFHIEEGEMIAIESFHFEGNTNFPDRTLQRQLSLRTRGLFQAGAFHEASLIADRHAIAQFYQDRGFIDAHVVDVVQEVRRDARGNNLMSITFNIYEGQMFTFGGVHFTGNHIFSDAQLSALVQSRVGEPANVRRIQADLMRVSGLYFEHGYIFNMIEPVPHQDREAGTISFNVFIVERGRAHIENIVVRGNQRTHDEVILREIPLQVGDVFSQARVMDGLRNLHNLQFFSAISPETPPGSVDSLMDLIINVEEMPTIDLMFGFSFSGSADPDTFPVSAMAQWNDRNFLGSGNTVGFQLNASFDTQSVSALHTYRWLFGLPFSASFDLTLEHTRRRAAMNNSAPFFRGDEPFAFPDGFNSFEEFENAFRIPPDQYLMPYNQWRLSLGIGTGYRWNTFLGILGVGGGTRIGMLRNTFDNDLYRPFDPVLRERNNMWTPALSLWTSVSLDRRDIFFDPTRGYYAFQRISWHGFLPAEQEHYIRTDTRLQWFHTLVDLPVGENWNFRAVLGLHTGLSFIFSQPTFDRPHVLEINQLAVDGMFIGRGWTSEFRRKGFALWDNWAEIRIPLAPGIIAWDFFFDAAGIKRTPSSLFTEFFADDGSLADSETFFMRFSVGGGLRFTIPQFPFRFSLARRFLYRDGAIQWAPGGIGGSGWDFVVSFALTTF